MEFAVLLAFLSTFFLLLCLISFQQERRERVKQRLNQFFSEAEIQETQRLKNAEAEEGNKLKKNLLNVFPRRNRQEKQVGKEDKNKWRRKMLNELSQAGIPLRPEEYLLLRLVVSILLAFILLLVTNLILALAGFMTGFYLLPMLYLNRAKRVRINQFNYQLSSALSTMANSLRAGFSLFQAMKSLSQEMSPPLSTEFARTLQEINLGTPTEHALQNMSDRVKSEDLELVVTAMIIQRQVGGNLAEVLDKIAHTIRDRIRVQREIKTLTAQGRISGIIIGLLPFFLAGAIILLNPGYMGNFFSHPLGYFLTAVGLTSQVVGVMFIRKIVNIQW